MGDTLDTAPVHIGRPANNKETIIDMFITIDSVNKKCINTLSKTLVRLTFDKGLTFNT